MADEDNCETLVIYRQCLNNSPYVIGFTSAINRHRVATLQGPVLSEFALSLP